MIGRTDTHKEICDECKGTGRDPRKRTRQCAYCNGTAMVDVCDKCGGIVGRGCNSGGVLDATECMMKRGKDS